jgi:hypothetical protein
VDDCEEPREAGDEDKAGLLKDITQGITQVLPCCPVASRGGVRRFRGIHTQGLSTWIGFSHRIA